MSISQIKNLVRWFPQQRLNSSVTIAFLAQQDFRRSLEQTPGILGTDEWNSCLPFFPIWLWHSEIAITEVAKNF